MKKVKRMEQSFLSILYQKIINLFVSRWDIVDEFCEVLSGDPCLDYVDQTNISYICYAPNIGYRSWIFRYKGVYMSLFDCGNGNYSFHTVVSLYDVVVAVALSWLERKVYSYEVFH